MQGPHHDSHGFAAHAFGHESMHYLLWREGGRGGGRGREREGGGGMVGSKGEGERPQGEVLSTSTFLPNWSALEDARTTKTPSQPI